MTALVEVREVSKAYGSLVVASDISFSLDAGEVLGILGPNGAGKTTLFNMISGDVAPDAGRIFLGGADVTRLRPHERCRRGIGRSYQIARPFGGLTVFENVLVGAIFGGGAGRPTPTAAASRCSNCTDFCPKRTGSRER